MTGGTGESDDKLEELRLVVRRTLEQLEPFDEFDHFKCANEIKSVVMGELAKQLEPVIRAQMASLPQNTLEDKRQLASWVNYVLRGIGLAIRSPESGAPAILIAAAGRRDENEGSRFMLEFRDKGGRKVRATVAPLSSLELMEDTPRAEGRSRFQE